MARRSGLWVIDLPPRRAKAPAHRTTGNPRGRPRNDDDGLADVVERLRKVFGDDEDTVGLTAKSLTGLGIDETSARKRVQRELKRARRIRIWPPRSRP